MTERDVLVEALQARRDAWWAAGKLNGDLAIADGIICDAIALLKSQPQPAPQPTAAQATAKAQEEAQGSTRSVGAESASPAEVAQESSARAIDMLSLDAARALYRPPFRHDHGYIWDADGNMVADDDPEHSGAMVRVRGWGRIQYKANPEGLHDAVGALIAQALNEYYENRIAKAAAPSGERR